MRRPIRLNDFVRDTLTGFEGTAVARAEYLFGCVQICIQPHSLGENGKPIEDEWFDEQRLIVSVITRVKEEEPKPVGTKPGGPQPHPPTRNHP